LSNVVILENISKTFRSGEQVVVANNHVNLEVEEGKIHAIVGENGAGKTTLMNILYGLEKPDSGRIEVRGHEEIILNPRKAISLGIGMVHQHFMLVPELTIAENIVLGDEPQRNGFFNPKKAISEVEEMVKRYRLFVDPKAEIRNVPVGIQQRTEILKVLYRGANILILDEPTAVLTPQETKELFIAIKKLVNVGTTILFITHKLREVMEISDKITVMRNGEVVGNLITKNTSESELANLMVGYQLEIRRTKKPTVNQDVILNVNRIKCLNSRGLLAVNDISFELCKGEILGIAGISNNGQEELAEALMGLRKIISGSIEFKGKDITNNNTRSIKEMGCGHIPDDRYAEGCALQATIRENLISENYYKNPLSGKFWMNKPQIIKFTNNLIHTYDVRTLDPDISMASLSGGNIQKAIVAKEMTIAKDLLIAEQPSRGIDIGATTNIHQEIMNMRNRGCGILLISTELSEILFLSTRILVIFEGKIVGECKPDETTEEELGLLMAGVNNKKTGLSHGHKKASNLKSVNNREL